MSESGESGVGRLRAVCALAAVTIFLGVVFTTHFLIEGVVENGGRIPTAIALVLLLVTAVETVAVVALARLRPPMWYGGMATFGVAALVVLSVLVVDARLLSVLYLLVTASVAVGIYVLRPLYTPGTDARREALAADSVLPASRLRRQLRRSDASRELRAFVLFVLLAAALSFYKGVQLFWQSGATATYVGLAYLLLALVQVWACYGLWLRRRRGWFVSLAICSVVTVVAAYHALVAEDLGSVLLFLLDASNVVYLYGNREAYVPGLSVRITPE